MHLLCTDAKTLFIKCWQNLHGKEVTGHSARRPGAMYYVRSGLPIQELAFLGRWKSSVVLCRGSTARKANVHPILGDFKNRGGQVEEEKGHGHGSASFVQGNEHKEAIRGVDTAFSKPKDLWVVTKGKGWKQRPRHLVTKAAWSLPVKERSTACGWLFAANATEFYFLSSNQVDKLKCTKCQAYIDCATKSERCSMAPELDMKRIQIMNLKKETQPNQRQGWRTTVQKPHWMGGWGFSLKCDCRK